MKYNKRLPIVLAIMFVFLAILPSGAAQSAQTASIRLLFTHDMHSALLPAVVADEDGNLSDLGGFARLYTAIQQESAAVSSAALLLDAGDYSMGTLFQVLEATHAPALRLLGAMGYDAVTAGNHEFDYTLSGFTQSLEAAVQSGDKLPAMVVSNMTLPDNEPEADTYLAAADAYGIQEYTVIEKNGLSIGVFGLMGDEAAANAPMSKPAEFKDMAEASKNIVGILKDKHDVDLIVCLSHAGTHPDSKTSEDEQLALAVPEIDVIISGHSHTLLEQPIVVGSTTIVSAGYDGMYLGVLDLAYDQGWKTQDYRLRKIDASISEDAGLAAQIEDYKALVDAYLAPYGYAYDQIIVRSPYQFDDIEYMYANPHDYTLGNLTTDAFVHAVKHAEGDAYVPVDVAVVPMGTLRATINKGDITVAEAYKILSLGTGPDGLSGYPLISVYLNGRELLDVCEVDASVGPMMSSAQLFLAGLGYTYNPNRLIFNKVTQAHLQKEDGSTESIDPDKTYRVVCGLYSGQMLAYVKSKSFGILSITPKDAAGNEIIDFDAHIIYDEHGMELKEWEAVVGYLQSFEPQDGVSAIPADYAAPQGRKAVFDSTNIFDIVSHFNTFAWIAVAVVVFLLALIVFIIVRIARGAKKRRLRRVQQSS